MLCSLSNDWDKDGCVAYSYANDWTICGTLHGVSAIPMQRTIVCLVYMYFLSLAIWNVKANDWGNINLKNVEFFIHTQFHK